MTESRERGGVKKSYKNALQLGRTKLGLKFAAMEEGGNKFTLCPSRMNVVDGATDSASAHT
jgi:hypothetical protein